MYQVGIKKKKKKLIHFSSIEGFLPIQKVCPQVIISWTVKQIAMGFTGGH